jgi:hypothetical protein
MAWNMPQTRLTIKILETVLLKHTTSIQMISGYPFSVLWRQYCDYVCNVPYGSTPYMPEIGITLQLKKKIAHNCTHNKQVESCFLNQNSSIQFCCTDSLLMAHRGGLSLSIIIWRIGGGLWFILFIRLSEVLYL